MLHVAISKYFSIITSCFFKENIIAEGVDYARNGNCNAGG